MPREGQRPAMIASLGRPKPVRETGRGRLLGLGSPPSITAPPVAVAPAGAVAVGASLAVRVRTASCRARTQEAQERPKSLRESPQTSHVQDKLGPPHLADRSIIPSNANVADCA